MVLSAMPVGDYDKRLVILTKEHGKITAFAKGARRQNSALLACSGPFSFGEFTLYAGRSSYNIMSAEISNYFAELRSDIESLYYGFYFCEFADYITKENNDEKDVLKLLYQTLRAIAKKTIPLSLVKVIFEVKAMAINGEAPQVFQCVKCSKNPADNKKEIIKGEQDTLNHRSAVYTDYRFSIKSGGILCSECQFNDRSAIKIGTSTLYTLQYIISKEIEKLYTFTVSEEVLHELTRCTKIYLEHYIDHQFKSLEMIMSL
ncbi:DNA repair protein RecO [Mobilitalea sibirica]|uniref:DNA repair protein RecO n=2 Tax=Mobilitalea sibirica TaxID=1462919 RepID=A0A8J7HB04_9FIRM|nr:DNA repair protein RecO [Mobilitalea sibirica]